MIAEEAPAPSVAARSVVGQLVPWFALGAAAVVLFALYAHPLLALSVFCLKFAVADFLAAAWLLRRDPDPARGRACALLHLAAGVWKAVLVNYALLTAAVVFTAATGEFAWPHPENTDRPPDFVDDGLLPWAVPSVAGYAVAIALAAAAVSLAARAGVKVWLGRAAHDAWLHDSWPPSLGGSNRLAVGPGTALALVPLIIGLAGLAASRLFPTPAGLTAGSWHNALTIHWLGGLMLGLPPLMLVAAVHEGHPRRIAHTPAECWGKLAEEEKKEAKKTEPVG